MPERSYPAWAVHEGGLPRSIRCDVKVGPGKGDGEQEHSAPLRVHLLLPPLVYLDGAPVVAHRPVQPGEQRLGTLEKARAVGYLAGVALKAVEIADLAGRVEAVERVLKGRRKAG